MRIPQLAARQQRLLDLIEGDLPTRSPALGSVPALRVVEQDLPHCLRRDGEEVRVARPPRRRLVDEPEIRLMYQRGGVERLVAPPAPPLAAGEHAQLVVDERD